jgi:hypothetical protein
MNRSSPRLVPSLSARLLVAATVSVLLLLSASTAQGDLYGPDDTFSQAYGPLQPRFTYSGALRTPDDLDYFYFDISRAGETVEFTVQNTLQSCSSPYMDECPLWGTLLDGTEHQLGGEGSTAGTGEVDYASTDYIDWTFPQPGRYYLVLESSGDLPTYKLRLDPVPDPGITPPGGGSRPGVTLPALRSLRVLSPQRGDTVRARLVFGQPISRLEADLIRTPGGSRVSKIVRHRLAAGRYALAVRVNSAAARSTLRRAHRLRVALKIIARAASGNTRTVTRGVTLRG